MIKKSIAVVSVFLLLIVVGFALWGRDESTNENFIRLLQHPAVADHDNAYFFLLGFTAPVDKNPIDRGKDLFAQRSAKHTAQESHSPNDLRFSENVLSLCDKNIAGHPINVAACIVQDRPQIEKTLESNKALLDRYGRLLTFTKFTRPVEVTAPMPSFVDLQRAKFAWWAKAVLLIQDGRAGQGLEMLQQDTRFWRSLATQSDALLVRMIAISLLQRQYELFSQVINQFPTLVSQKKNELAQIARPLSSTELSFHNALIGELRLAADVLARFDQLATVQTNATAAQRTNWSLEHPFWRKTPLYRPNATFNLQAGVIDRWIMFSEQSAQKIVQQKDSFPQSLAQEFGIGDTSTVYNLIGRQLVAAGFADLSPYFLKAHDLDGLARLINLQIEIAALKLPDERVGPFVQTSDAAFANPYTGEPMLWDMKARTLSFKSYGSESGGEVAITLSAPRN